MSPRRILMMAEMHGRDLLRRHIALGLLVLLPFSFYLASAGSGQSAVSSGGVGMAFAVSGAALFSVLSSRAADQRLILCGYRPFEMLLGRLLFLGPLALVISFAFSGAMAVISEPTRPWVMVLGVAVVALQSVPVGLAVGAALPRELEGTLVLIGVIGIQLATRIDTVVSQVLPFYGPRELVEAALTHQGAIARPALETFFYGFALLIAARLFVSRRIDVVCHGALVAPTGTAAAAVRPVPSAADASGPDTPAADASGPATPAADAWRPAADASVGPGSAPTAVRGALVSAQDRWMGTSGTTTDPADRPGPIDIVDRPRRPCDPSPRPRPPGPDIWIAPRQRRRGA